MVEMIGQAAGSIWNYLNEKGESSVSKMKKELDLKGNMADLALGWLAREGKIAIAKKGLTTNVKLV